MITNTGTIRDKTEEKTNTVLARKTTIELTAEKKEVQMLMSVCEDFEGMGYKLTTKDIINGKAIMAGGEILESYRIEDIYERHKGKVNISYELEEIRAKKEGEEATNQTIVKHYIICNDIGSREGCDSLEFK